MSAISVEHLSRWWGTTRAVDDVSFEAAAGRMLVLLGPSGCGKSTTLRLIAGLEAATAGRVAIGGVDVTHRPPAERRVSMVFQSYALFPHLSVAENIVFGLRVRRVSAAERRERLARVADLLGLTALLERRPSQLSGGQQQRVALGRALIAEAPVCLMDEPLSNLDAQLRLEMRREIRGLQQSLGITMVYVTHDQTEAMTMADQVILLREGRVEQDAPPEALYARPSTAFAARFIGTPPMNVLALDDRRRLLGIRPEDIRVLGAKEPGAVEALVRSIEYLGADSILMCAIGRQALAVRAPGRVALAPGARVHVAWAPEAAHVFDAETGRRRDDVAADSPISR
ncbi:MAG TPA: ABC transporter ATP-binding protein [Candidatus Dormibacteraeota bacterium]|nr:ABC transporter ATP-binding protein [Candidatus Dormibacteraeota bacterium]